jgi:hypothetical protein
MPPTPVYVRISTWLLCATYIAGFATAIFDQQPLPRFSGDEDHLVFFAAMAGVALVAILLSALFLFIVQSMSRGKNWPRLILAGVVLLQAFHVLQLPGNFAGPLNNPFASVMLWVIQCIAVTLLFLPTSNRWYRSFRLTRTG